MRHIRISFRSHRLSGSLVTRWARVDRSGCARCKVAMMTPPLRAAQPGRRCPDGRRRGRVPGYRGRLRRAAHAEEPHDAADSDHDPRPGRRRALEQGRPMPRLAATAQWWSRFWPARVPAPSPGRVVIWAQAAHVQTQPGAAGNRARTGRGKREASIVSKPCRYHRDLARAGWLDPSPRAGPRLDWPLKIAR